MNPLLTWALGMTAFTLAVVILWAATRKRR